MKRVFIIHGWDSNNKDCWFPWLKNELEKNNFKVEVPNMPNSKKPEIKPWIDTISKLVDIPNENTYFVGHSVGCQAILRYLETINRDIKINSIILVAPWMHLDEETIREEGPESVAIAKPWIETPIDFKKVLSHINNKTVCLFSKDDPFIPLSDSKLFEKGLNANIIIENNKGHFSGAENILELPVVLKELLKLSR